jgi:hypothetical protein
MHTAPSTQSELLEQGVASVRPQATATDAPSARPAIHCGSLGMIMARRALLKLCMGILTGFMGSDAWGRSIEQL